MQREGSVGGSAGISVRVAGGVLLVAHLLFVAWVTQRPLDVPWVLPANLHPLAGIRSDLALGWQEAARRIAGGLGLLAPLGVLIPLTHGRLTVSPPASLLRTTAAGALISLGIELLQTGVPGQRTDIDSLLLNTAGVALAHAAVVPGARSWVRRRNARLRGGSGSVHPGPGSQRPGSHVPGSPGQDSQGQDSQGLTPTIPRVGIAPWTDASSGSRP